MKIQVFSTSKREGKPKPWLVRWRVDGRDKSRSFTKRATADKFRRRLELAVENGVEFDTYTCLPKEESSEQTFVEYSHRWLNARWQDLGNTTRRDYAEALARAAVVFDPSLDRLELQRSCLIPSGSVPLSTVSMTDIRLVQVEDWYSSIRRRTDGKSVAKSTLARRFRPVAMVFAHAVRAGELSSNPIDRLELRRHAPGSGEVRQVISHDDFLRVIETSEQICPNLTGYWAALFYGGLRTAEANSLRLVDLELPISGWGGINVRRGAVASAHRYSDTQTSMSLRPLKWRAEGASRYVPVPPQLVRLLRSHIEHHEPRDFLFVTKNETLHTPQNLGRRWRRIRELVWPPDPSLDAEDQASLTLCTPYDLRASNATMLLRAGVPVGEVATRLGHSVDVLLKTYAGVVAEDRSAVNAQIEALLTATRADQI